MTPTTEKVTNVITRLAKLVIAVITIIATTTVIHLILG